LYLITTIPEPPDPEVIPVPQFPRPAPPPPDPVLAVPDVALGVEGGV
jgi:hypothetical protein